MKMFFNLTKLNSHNRDFKIHFLNQTNITCQVAHNSTENIINNQTIWLESDYDKCGIDVQQRDGKIVYNQTVVVTYGKDLVSTIVSRKENTFFTAECLKANNFTVQLEGNYFNVTFMKKQTFHKGKVILNII